MYYILCRFAAEVPHFVQMS